MNPMLLNAQLQALAAQSNPLLSGMYGSQFHPGLLQAQQSAALAERLRAMQAVGAGSPAVGSTPGGGPTEGPTRGASTGNRYSPYPLPSPPTSSSLSLSSPTHTTSSSSAFSAVKKSGITSDQGPVKSEAMEARHSNNDLKIPPISSPTRQPAATSPLPHRPSSKEAIGDHIMTENDSVGAKSEIKSEETTQQHTKISDIKNMEELVNGLNGSAASKFGISHNNNDQQISA